MDALASVGELPSRDWEDTTANGTVRFALIGCGWWTRDEAIPAIRNSDYCTTTVVVSGSQEKGEQTAALANSIEHAITYEEFHGGAASEAYDAVYVCTPNGLHLPYVETAVHLDKAVLCEKPMEATVSRAEKLAAITEDADKLLMIGYRMQTEPAVRKMRNLLRTGVLGDPVFVQGHMSQPLLEVIPNTDQWRLDPELSGGTTLMDIGLYPLNTARFVLEADPLSGRATTYVEQEPFEETGDEHVAFSLDFPNAVSVSCTASYTACKASSFRVIGTKGEARIEPVFYPDERRRLYVSTDGDATELDVDPVNQMLEEFDYFAHCLLSNKEPYANGQHALTDIRVMKRLYEAADNQKTVDL